MKQCLLSFLVILRDPEFFKVFGDDGRKVSVAAIIGGFIGYYVKVPQISSSNAVSLVVLGVILWLTCSMIGVSGIRQLKIEEEDKS